MSSIDKVLRLAGSLVRQERSVGVRKSPEPYEVSPGDSRLPRWKVDGTASACWEFETEEEAQAFAAKLHLPLTSVVRTEAAPDKVVRLSRSRK